MHDDRLRPGNKKLPSPIFIPNRLFTNYRFISFPSLLEHVKVAKVRRVKNPMIIKSPVVYIVY